MMGGMQMQPMMGGMHEGGSKLSASAQEFIPGGAGGGGGMPNGGASMDAFSQSQFRFNVGAAEFTPTGQTVQPNAGFAVQPQMQQPMMMAAPMPSQPMMMMMPVNGAMNNGGVIMQPMGVPMGVGVQQAPMAMMQSGQPAWGQQQPQNGNHGGPAQIQHVIGTTPQMPEQQPAQNASNKAAPGRLQNKSKGLQNRPKAPAAELTSEAPMSEPADKAAWGQSRKKLVNATMAHGPADLSSNDGRASKPSSQPYSQPPSHPATPAA